MLGRCRLRRGVSLEVIVEEDDTAEVTLDPTPLPEEDDDDDDEEEDIDSEHGARGSAPSSPRGRGGEGGGEAMAAEERRRRRERRRTIGGLSRIRSVSCEALTLLDTSDMDMCCSEWDDDDDLATTSSNYVTLNRPISRRRILESTQTQCDSEDSGIEYQSNEDDPALEDRSSAEDHSREDSMPVDIHEAETATESEGEEVEEEREEEEERVSSPSPSQATLPEEDTYPGLPQGPEEGDLLTGTSKKQVFEGHGMQPAKGNQTTTPKFAPTEALENDKVVIVETTPPVPSRRPAQHEATLDPAEEELQLKRAAYTIRNKEVRLAELPKPDTVRSVKQLFEEGGQPLQHLHAWRDLGRFRDIKSNPSSKILRFDRSEGDSGRRGHGLRDGSQTLPRLPSHSGARLSSSAPRPQPTSAPHQLLAELRRHQQSQKGLASPQPRPARAPAAHGGSATPSVVLRKPVVRGFNVKKALLEDPKSFLPHSHESKKKSGGAPGSGKGTASRRHSHTYSREKAHHHSDVIDRSDTESLASDLSDDSGVSNDSTVSSSASTSATYRALDAYAADPSFKWIDPSVMAKIRSVGTTVIFFGPRPRPRSQDGALAKGASSTSSGLQAFGGLSSASKGKQRGGPSVHFDDITRSVAAAPRIVGVVRKRTPSSSSTGGSGHPTPTPTPTPSEFLSDDSRASSPGGRSSEEASGGKAGRWRAEGDNTVVYDFTRGHAQPGCV